MEVTHLLQYRDHLGRCQAHGSVMQCQEWDPFADPADTGSEIAQCIQDLQFCLFSPSGSPLAGKHRDTEACCYASTPVNRRQ